MKVTVSNPSSPKPARVSAHQSGGPARGFAAQVADREPLDAARAAVIADDALEIEDAADVVRIASSGLGRAVDDLVALA